VGTAGSSAILIVASIVVLAETIGRAETIVNLTRFLTDDIVPSLLPGAARRSMNAALLNRVLRGAGDGARALTIL